MHNAKQSMGVINSQGPCGGRASSQQSWLPYMQGELTVPAYHHKLEGGGGGGWGGGKWAAGGARQAGAS